MRMDEDGLFPSNMWGVTSFSMVGEHAGCINDTVVPCPKANADGMKYWSKRSEKSSFRMCYNSSVIAT